MRDHRKLSPRASAEGSPGCGHQKDGHQSCLTQEKSIKAISFYRDTKGFKMWGMSPDGRNYARACSGGRSYRVSRGSCSRGSAGEADLAEHQSPRQELHTTEDAGLVRGWAHYEARRVLTGGNGAGRYRRPPCSAPAPGGGACRRLSPPKERQRRWRKRHSFCVATRLRGHFQPWIIFWKIPGGKVTVPRLTGNLPQYPWPWHFLTT